MDGNATIMRLRSMLQLAGVDAEEIDARCADAAREISDELANIVHNAINEAEQRGLEMGATDFVAELTINVAGSNIYIATDSGRTDFSNPPWPMLPGLLRNAKISKKTGHRYKRIPMGKQSAPRDSMSATADRADALEQSKARIRDDISERSSVVNVNRAAQQYAQEHRNTRPTKHADKRPDKNGKPTHWVTATDDPNSKTKWIYPAKHYDTASIILDINNELQRLVVDLMDRIMTKYGA